MAGQHLAIPRTIRTRKQLRRHHWWHVRAVSTGTPLTAAPCAPHKASRLRTKELWQGKIAVSMEALVLVAHQAPRDHRIKRGQPGTSSPRHIGGGSRQGAGRSRATRRSRHGLHSNLLRRIRTPSRALTCKGRRVPTGCNLRAQKLWGAGAPWSPPRPRSTSTRGQVLQ